jgi:hypothetical protein
MMQTNTSVSLYLYNIAATDISFKVCGKYMYRLLQYSKGYTVTATTNSDYFDNINQLSLVVDSSVFTARQELNFRILRR